MFVVRKICRGWKKREVGKRHTGGWYKWRKGREWRGKIREMQKKNAEEVGSTIRGKNEEEEEERFLRLWEGK